jgi:predicted kinase
VRTLVAGGATVVAEAAFQDRFWRQGLAPLRELAGLRIVQCHVDAALGRERARRRQAESPGHDRAHGHVVGTRLDEWERAYASFERVSLDAPSLDVDTTDGYAPTLVEIVAFVNAHPVP